MHKSSKVYLSVYTRVKGVTAEEPVWTLSGGQSDEWQPAAVTIQLDQFFQVNTGKCMRSFKQTKLILIFDSLLRKRLCSKAEAWMVT